LKSKGKSVGKKGEKIKGKLKRGNKERIIQRERNRTFEERK